MPYFERFIPESKRSFLTQFFSHVSVHAVVLFLQMLGLALSLKLRTLLTNKCCMYVCMYLSIYLCVYVCMYLCMYVCMYVSICVCMYVCMYVCTCMCVCMYVCTCMCVCMYVCVYVCMYVCIYVCVYVPCEQTVKTAQELRNPVYCGVATKTLPYDQVEILGSHKVMLICNYSSLLPVVWIRPAT